MLTYSLDITCSGKQGVHHKFISCSEKEYHVTGSEKTSHIAHSMKFELLKSSTIIIVNLTPSLRQIVRFALELERFVRDRAALVHTCVNFLHKW